MVAALLVIAAATQLPGQHAYGPSTALFPIIEALVNDNETAVEEQLAAGADLNVLDVITPLYACQEYVRNSKKRHRLLRRLLRAGALPDMPTNDGSTTLMLAAYHGDVRSVQMLLDHGADPLRKNKSFGCGRMPGAAATCLESPGPKNGANCFYAPITGRAGPRKSYFLMIQY